MKKGLLLLLIMSSLLVGCHSDLKFDNVDTTAQMELGIVFPLGTMHLTMADFLGEGQVDGISLDEYGVFQYTNRIEIPEKPYHRIDVASYIMRDQALKEFYIQPAIGGASAIPATGDTYTLDFPLELSIEGINNDTSIERIDSVWVTKAKFYSNITTDQFDLRWDEIKSVKLRLGEQFRRGEKDIVIPIDGRGFGQDIEIDVNTFTLNLMKNIHNPRAGSVNKIKFNIIFEVCPNRAQPIMINEYSKFAYNLRVQMIDYDAIWGYFQAGPETRDTRLIDMDSLWDEWENIKKLKMRFAEPRVKIYLTHGIAAPLMVHVDELTAIDSLGKRKSATWDNEKETDLILKKTLANDMSTYGQTITNDETLTHEASKGNIDELFDVRPDSFFYSYYMLVNKNVDYPQHRIVKKDSLVWGWADVTIPFAFNKGSEAQYITTFTDVDISEYTLDSLLEEAELADSVHASNLKMILKVENRIPFDIDATFTFLDEDSLDMHMELVEGNTNNRFHLPAPQMTKTYGETDYGTVTDPSITDIVIDIEKADFDRFIDVEYIRMDAAMTGNPQRCRLTKDTSIDVKVSITAVVDATYNFGNKK